MALMGQLYLKKTRGHTFLETVPLKVINSTSLLESKLAPVGFVSYTILVISDVTSKYTVRQVIIAFMYVVYVGINLR